MTDPTRLIVIGGFAGSGKSALAARLGRALSLPVIDLDVISHALQSSKDFSGGPGVSFDLAYALVEDLLRRGTSLIFEQNLGREQTWKRLKQICESLGNVEFSCLILDCPYEVCASRVATRGPRPGRVALSVEELDKHKYKWDYISNANVPEAIRIDATQSSDAVFQEVISWIVQQGWRCNQLSGPQAHAADDCKSKMAAPQSKECYNASVSGRSVINSEKLEFSALSTETRQSLHRALYRQECRAWLLAIGLLCSAYLLVDLHAVITADFLKTVTKWYAGIAGVFLAFWVVHPSQLVLVQLRKAKKAEDENTQGQFYNSWQSLWDFCPPLLLPIGFWLMLLLLPMTKAK